MGPGQEQFGFRMMVEDGSFGWMDIQWDVGGPKELLFGGWVYRMGFLACISEPEIGDDEVRYAERGRVDFE